MRRAVVGPFFKAISVLPLIQFGLILLPDALKETGLRCFSSRQRFSRDTGSRRRRREEGRSWRSRSPESLIAILRLK